MNIQEFTQIKENVWDLIKLTGNVSDLKMTFTFVSIRESSEKISCFFIFYPFVSGLEETFQKEKRKPWEESYSGSSSIFGDYPKFSHFYIKECFQRIL